MRKTVEAITWYEPPDQIINKLLTRRGWDYHRDPVNKKIRDLALIAVLYVGTARITEAVGGTVKIQGKDHTLPGITRDQFIEQDQAIWLRHLPIIKQKYVKRGGRWVPILSVRDYPKRVEIPFMLDDEPINRFTYFLRDHLETIPDGEPVFKIQRTRGNQIIDEYDPEWFPHYFRDQGLRYWNRYFKRDSFKLKKFSGHKRWSSLEKYMNSELYHTLGDT